MKILGLDLSLTKPGIAYGTIAVTLDTPKVKGVERLGYWRDVFGELFRNSHFDVVIMEGYSFGSHDSYARGIAELGGVVRLLMRDALVPYAEVAPTSLKKYATSKGNASKEAVTMAAVHRAGRVFSDNNASDAWWLMQMGLAHYTPDDPLCVSLPAVNRLALVNVEWPKLTTKVGK